MIKDFEIKKDDILIRGEVYLPPDYDGQAKLPVIIMSHEFGLTLNSTARYARRICPSGYAVCIFDFPGSGFGKSQGRDSVDMSIFTLIDDLLSVFEYIKTLDYIDKDRIIMGGLSQGGLVTALFAAEHADEIYKMFLYYPALCIPDEVRAGNIMDTKIDLNNLEDKFRVTGSVNLGKKFVEDAIKLDPWKEMEGFDKPVLICHGTKDELVDISYAKKAADLYKDCKLVEVKGGKHIFFMPWHINDVVFETVNFLNA